MDDETLVGRWTGNDGRLLPDGTTDSAGILVVSTSTGSSTCTDANGTVFAQLAWPVGRELNLNDPEIDDSDAPRFIRDTTGSLLKTDGPSDLDAALPSKAHATGFPLHGNTMAFDDKPIALYVIRPNGRTERWARLVDETGCA